MITFKKILEEIKRSKKADCNECGICPLHIEDYIGLDEDACEEIDEKMTAEFGLPERFHSRCFRKYAEYVYYLNEKREVPFIKELGNPRNFCIFIHDHIDERIRFCKKHYGSSEIE